MNNDQTVFQSSSSQGDVKSQPQNTTEPVFASSPSQKLIPQDFTTPLPSTAVPSQQIPLEKPVPEPFVQPPPIEQVIQQPALSQAIPEQKPIEQVAEEQPLPPLPEVAVQQETPFTQSSQDPLALGNQLEKNLQQSADIPPPPPAPVVDTHAGSDAAGDSSGGNSFATIKKLVKVFIGLFVVIILAAIIFFVIIPQFTKTSGKTTLIYWGLWENSNTMQGIIADFERQNPNIIIDYSKQDVKQYRERLVTRIANGNGPDIFRFHNSWYPMLSGNLLALPSDTITKDDFNKSFYPVVQNDLVKNGAIYGIPLEIDTLALFVNTQLFQSAGLKPPTNWNDFIDDARALTVKDANGKIKTAGAAMGTYNNITHAPDIVSLLFLQNGVDLNKLASSPSDRAAGALTFYSSFSTDQNNVWDNSLDPSILAFSKGNLAMYFGYSWDYFSIKQANPDLSFQIAPVPQLPGKAVTIASYWVEGVSAKTKHPKEALLFMQYLAQKTTEEALYADEAKTRGFGELYARTDLASTLVTNPTLSPFILQAPEALSSFIVDQTYDNGLNQESNTYLENAVNSISKGTSPQSAFDTLSQGISQVQQKYGQ